MATTFSQKAGKQKQWIAPKRRQRAANPTNREDFMAGIHFRDSTLPLSSEDVLNETGILGSRDSRPPPAFDEGSSLFDPIGSEEPEIEQHVPRSKFRGSPPKMHVPCLSSKNSAKMHESNIQIIFDNCITLNHCRENERGQLKKTLFREIRTGPGGRIEQLLVWTGMPSDIRDELERTPTIIAAEKHGTETLETLLNLWKEQDLEQTDNSGDTALIAAASEGNKDSVILLAGAGAKLDARNSKNKRRTALIFAAFEEHADTVKTLISLGADPTLKDASKKTAADYAKLNGDKKLVAYLRKREDAWKKKH